MSSTRRRMSLCGKYRLAQDAIAKLSLEAVTQHEVDAAAKDGFEAQLDADEGQQV